MLKLEEGKEDSIRPSAPVLWGGWPENITLDYKGGSPIMITIYYIGRGGVKINPKSDYVILEQSLMCTLFLITLGVL